MTEEGRLLSHATGKPIDRQSLGGGNGNGEPPGDDGDLRDRVNKLEVEQRHLASKADIEGLKSWLAERLDSQQRWFTDRLDGSAKRLDGVQWRLLGFFLAGLGVLLTAFGFLLRLFVGGSAPSS